MNSFALSQSKRSTNSSFNKTEKISSLSDKIAQCWLRQNNEEYQQLLIETKELELALLKEQTLHKSILKSFNNKKIEVEELKEQLAAINAQALEKKNYLNDYYQYLNDKLKSGSGTINLNVKLDNLTHTLNSKIEAQKINLNQIVTKLKSQALALEQELLFLENKKQSVVQNLKNLRQQKEIFRHEKQRRRQAEEKRRKAEREEYNQLQKQMQNLFHEKYELEKNETIFKKLLNMQQVHKKHWAIIQKAIKTEFTSKIMETHYKQSIQMEYKLKVHDIENELIKNKEDLLNLKEVLNQKLTQREKQDRKLQEAQRKNIELNKQLEANFARKSIH